MTAPVPTTAHAAQPAWRTMAWDRFRIETIEFVRSREQMIFIFAFPMIFLVLFGTIFGGQLLGDTDVTFAQYFLAGMIATGIINTGFQSLAMGIAIDRQEDILKRIHATPLRASAFFAGKILQVLVVSVIQVGILIALGVALYDVQLPASAATWWTFTWVFIVGLAASSALGIATSSLLRNGKAASAILTPVVLVLQFTSGVFVVFTQLPSWLQDFASFFPLKWLAQGMRSVFLPDYFEAAEASGSWQHPETAAMLGIWLAIGLLVAMRTFRWLRFDDK